jgi:hypothetical protein
MGGEHIEAAAESDSPASAGYVSGGGNAECKVLMLVRCIVRML